MGSDLRYAIRKLRRNPGFTLVAVCCLALGIGANSAVFSFAHALLFRPPQVREPDRLVRLFIRSSAQQYGAFSYPDYVDLKEQSEVFSALVAERPLSLHLSGGDRNEVVWGSLVSGDYFRELGVEIPWGRGFLAVEDRTPGTHPVVVISHSLWERRFGRDPQALGTTVWLNGRPFTLIGVAPQGFRGIHVGIRSELWAPMMMQGQLMPGADLLKARGWQWVLFVIGRLKPGVALEQARQSTQTFWLRQGELYPDSTRGKSIDIYREAEAGLHPVVRGGVAPLMGLMFAVVGMVLLLACSNVAGLLLARYAARRQEIGIRLALGVSRWRLVRQLLAEGAVLGTISAAAGLLMAWLLIRLVGSFRPPSELPLHLEVDLNPAVLSFTLLIAVLTIVLFGLIPALQASRLDLIPGLTSSRRTGGVPRLRRWLVTGQITVTFVLLVSAGLVLESLNRARSIDLGFQPEQLVVGVVDLTAQGYDEVSGRRFRETLKERLRNLPGVDSVGFAARLPLHFNPRQTPVIPEGYRDSEERDVPSIDFNTVDEDYFETMGIPILRGRAFRQADAQDAQPVVVVNERFIQIFWPGQEPIGKSVRIQGKDHEVVGLVATGKYFSLGEDPKAFIYLSSSQHDLGSTALHVRTALPPERMTQTIREQLRRLDPMLPVSDLGTMRQALGFAFLPARISAAVLSSFALLAQLLAAVGLYGLIAFWVNQSRREIGIRVALGAGPSRILRLVVGKSMRLTFIGLLLGLAGALLLSGLIEGLLYGVQAVAPGFYLLAGMILLAVALLAGALPAYGALRMHPGTLLRVE